jgi:hypothetical protein
MVPLNRTAPWPKMENERIKAIRVTRSFMFGCVYIAKINLRNRVVMEVSIRPF